MPNKTGSGVTAAPDERRKMMFYKKNTAKELDNALFKNPTSEYRGTPFWAWNCKMTPELLGEQIDCLREMGFGGFHMHSRAGMAMPYLGEDFMNLVKFCTEKAKKDGMLAYLYDEDKWPSGFAGGYVTKNPRFRMRCLKFSTTCDGHFPRETALNEGKTYLMAVYDVVLDENGELAEYRRIGENDAARGRKWYALITTQKESPWYNNQTYVDTLSKEAIDEFIKITHEAYKKAVGDEFGKTVPSIFTDEPQFSLKKSLGFADSTDCAEFPWTFSIEEGFAEKYGYDIADKLPELVWNLPNGKASVARYHYHDFISDLFTRSFADNCGKWCDENGISLTGHMNAEDTLESQTKFLGETMRSYRAFGIPGIDMLCNNICLATAKQCQSAVHQFGREAMLSELYGVTNWDFDFRGHKFQGDWQAALGVTIRVPHLSWVSMAGEAKRDYPASISYQSPWYKEYKYVEDHFARVNTALTRGKPDVRVAVVHPVESYWINFGPSESTLAIREQLDSKFSDIIKWLLFGTVDFDFLSESLLPEQFRGTDGALRVGEMSYDAVVVPDCITIRRTTLDILKKFAENGGKVIFAGECPKYIDAVEDDGARALYDACHIPYDKISLLSALREFRTVEIKADNGAPSVNLIYNMRRDDNCKWLFIAHGEYTCQSTVFWNVMKAPNPREDADVQSVNIIVDGEYKPVLYDTLSGEIYDIPYTCKNGKTVIKRDIYINDSVLLKLTENAKGAVTEEKPACCCKPSKTIRFMDRVSYERCEPNALLLDRAEYSLDGEPFNAEEEILVLDNLCRERMGWPLRGDQFAQPWVVEEAPIVNYITLKMTVNSEIDVTGASLAIEDAETLEITFNGERVPSDVTGWYVDKAIRTVALPPIHTGRNELIVKVPFGKRTNTEWCYILGDFNVRSEGTFSAITAPTDKIGFAPLASQGMPFYGGNIIYKAEIDTPECTAVIHTKYYRGALVKVRIDGEEKGIIAYSPYTLTVDGLSNGRHTVEFVLFGTRINTFGGMHNVNKPHWVGADFWRTTGDAWCYEYQFKDTGILAGPIIEIYEK